MKKREKLFIFDIGGVFVKLDPASRDRAVSKPGEAGPSLRYGDVPEAIFRDFRLGRLAERDYVQALARIFDVPHESIYEAEHAYVAEGFQDFIEFVRRLRENHRVVCLSNNQAIHWRHITDNLLGAGYFDREYLSHEMGLEKPDRAIFEAISQAEGCSEKDVFFIDDMEENVLSAREIGWQHCIVHRDPAATAKLLVALAAEQTLN